MQNKEMDRFMAVCVLDSDMLMMMLLSFRYTGRLVT
jgi:hypothetical protein